MGGQHGGRRRTGTRKGHGPSIERPAACETLREKGMSKEKAARISSVGLRTAARRGGKRPPYEAWTKEDLLDKARELRLDIRFDMAKDRNIRAIRGR